MKFLHYFSIFIVLALSGAAVGWLIVSISISGRGVPCPDLTGKTLMEALQITGPMDIYIGLEDKRFDRKVERDRIISQKPAPGTTIKKGRKIFVTVSLGAKEVVIPDLAELSQREVEAFLHKMGLKKGFIGEVHSAHYARGKVISQQPLPGTRATIGDKVNFLVSLGAREVWFVTPDWIGQSISVCRNQATRMNLRVEVKQRKIAPEYPRGTVLEQNPAAGYPVREGDIVTVIVSRKSRLDDDRDIEYKPFLYVVPDGLFPRELRITLAGLNGMQETEVFKKEVLPGERVYQLLPYKEGSYLKVYLNGNLVLQEEKNVEKDENSHTLIEQPDNRGETW